MSERPLAILIAGDPVARVREIRGGWAELIRETAGNAWTGPWLEVDLRSGGSLPSPAALAGAIVSGSSASVADREPWVLRGEGYLRDLVSSATPVLGICFGHQMLGQALGGEVVQNPRGREIGTVDLEVLEDDPLLSSVGLPAHANMSHRDTVARLPAGARVLARTRLEPHAAVRFADLAWGVQFHPEIDAEVMRLYLEARRPLVEAEGGDVDALLATVGEARYGARVIPRFVEYAANPLRRSP